MPDAAANSYDNAARLFIDSGMTLQAIVSKSLQWKINPPSDLKQIKQFFSTIKNACYHETPVNAFFSNFEYPVMVAILFPLIKIRLPAGTMVKKAGDEEKYPAVEKALVDLFGSQSGIEEKEDLRTDRNRGPAGDSHKSPITDSSAVQK